MQNLKYEYFSFGAFCLNQKNERALRASTRMQ